MSNTFTAQGLSDFYQKVADGGEVQLNNGKNLSEWKDCPTEPIGPSTGSKVNLWRIKPTKKVIDLSVLIESGIDCEFKDDISERITIGKLESVYDWPHSDEYPYKTSTSRVDGHGQCQPRRNHKHAWQGGECPLPEGFLVRVWRRDVAPKALSVQGQFVAEHLHWTNSGHKLDIIAFEVLGLADGYVMPWEQDNEF